MDQWETVMEIREFNRFYTVLLGLLDRNYLDSGYSVTETRILFELKQRKQMSANQLTELLHLDKGYVSRLIRNFEQKEIVTREVDSKDRRVLVVQLTPKGQREVETLVDITNHEICKLIAPLDAEACRKLCGAMKTIQETFFDQIQSQEGTYENRY